MHATIQPIAAPRPLDAEPWQPMHGVQADDLALLTRGLGRGLDLLLGSKPVPPAPKIACARPVSLPVNGLLQQWPL